MASSSTSPVHHTLQPSTLVRLAPFELTDIPSHPDLPLKPAKSSFLKPSVTDDIQQPDLLPFLTSLLNDGLGFLSPHNLQATFKHHSNKPASPSAGQVEVLTSSISTSALNNLPWASITTERRGSSASTNGAGPSPSIRRRKPRELQAEHWFARRSVHKNISSKSTETPGHASWEEFVFGLRDNHSKNEEAFTPTLFDARKVVDWAGQVRKLDEEGSLSREGYQDVTMAVYEMCHDLPTPLKPRVFGVLVVTASPLGKRDLVEGEKQKFVAVTVPVHMEYGVKPAFYANYKNLKEGEDEKRKREVVQGLYCAAETCTLRNNGDEEEIEWTMATASDAKGNLPMFLQKLALPGAVPKDVAFFIKWIQTVDDARIEGGDE